LKILEICIDEYELAHKGHFAGAQNAEVCSHLELDGLTPDIELVERLAKTTKLGIKVMIRNRGGTFHYSSEDIETMISQIHQFKAIKIEGFVLGATIKDECGIVSLDMSAILQLCKACYPYPVTIHKAIDTCSDIAGESQKLVSITNIKFILTSGGEPTAWQGRELLAELRKSLEPKIHIIGAGKVTYENIDELQSYTGLTYFHGKKIVYIPT
jgi:copper homeostasis protein